MGEREGGRESERARERESRRLRDEDSSSSNVFISDLMKSREYFNSPLFDFSSNCLKIVEYIRIFAT